MSAAPTAPAPPAPLPVQTASGQRLAGRLLGLPV